MASWWILVINWFNVIAGFAPAPVPWSHSPLIAFASGSEAETDTPCRALKIIEDANCVILVQIARLFASYMLRVLY